MMIVILKVPEIIRINFTMVSGKQLSRDLEEENERGGKVRTLKWTD